MKIECTPTVGKNSIDESQRRSERIKRTKQRHGNGAEAEQTKIIVLVMARSYLVIVETIKRRLEANDNVHFIFPCLSPGNCTDRQGTLKEKELRP